MGRGGEVHGRLEDGGGVVLEERGISRTEGGGRVVLRERGNSSIWGGGRVVLGA